MKNIGPGKDRFVKKATDDALKLYKNGMATYLEVITAQITDCKTIWKPS